MDQHFLEHIKKQIASIKKEGLYKEERVISSSQSSEIMTADGQKVLNFCANNYLGLADHPRLIEAAKKGLDQYGVRNGFCSLYLWHTNSPQRT